jgi:hypothetical protein
MAFLMALLLLLSSFRYAAAAACLVYTHKPKKSFKDANSARILDPTSLHHHFMVPLQQFQQLLV